MASTNNTDAMATTQPEIGDMIKRDFNCDERRGLMVGISTKFLEKELRKYVRQILDDLYIQLKGSNEIHKQDSTNYLKCYPDSSNLNYKAVNNNSEEDAIWVYKIVNALDLSKLFLPHHVKEYTGHDKWDMSALLHFIIIITIPEDPIRDVAVKVREVRNACAHSGYTMFAAEGYNDAFDDMRELVKESKAGDANQICEKLTEWQSKGENLCETDELEVLQNVYTEATAEINMWNPDDELYDQMSRMAEKFNCYVNLLSRNQNQETNVGMPSGSTDVISDQSQQSPPKFHWNVDRSPDAFRSMQPANISETVYQPLYDNLESPPTIHRDLDKRPVAFRFMEQANISETVYQLLYWNGNMEALTNWNCSLQMTKMAKYSHRVVDDEMRNQMAKDWIFREQKTPGVINEELKQLEMSSELSCLKKDILRLANSMSHSQN